MRGINNKIGDFPLENFKNHMIKKCEQENFKNFIDPFKIHNINFNLGEISRAIQNHFTITNFFHGHYMDVLHLDTCGSGVESHSCLPNFFTAVYICIRTWVMLSAVSFHLASSINTILPLIYYT